MTHTYSTRKQPRLLFDIETEANHEACLMMPEPKAPSNYTDPVKIAKYVQDQQAEAFDRAALDPDYGRILSIGYSLGPDMPVTVYMVGDHVVYDNNDPLTAPQPALIEEYDLSERDLIDDFWYALASCNGACVGYNILGFDLPYLMRRSMALGVRVPHIPNLAKFRTEPVTDLMAILYNWGSDKYKGLKQVCKLYGIPNPCPDADGSKVKTMTRDQLRAYQVSDVELVQQLYQKMNGIYFNH